MACGLAWHGQCLKRSDPPWQHNIRLAANFAAVAQGINLIVKAGGLLASHFKAKVAHIALVPFVAPDTAD